MAVINDSEIRHWQQSLKQMLERLDRLESEEKPIKKSKATNKELEKKYASIFQHSESKKKK